MDINQLSHILNQIHGSTYAEVKEILSSNPEILSIESDELLESMIENGEDAIEQERLVKDREFLKSCRENGIDEAISDSLWAQISSTTDNLLEELLTLPKDGSFSEQEFRELLSRYPNFEMINAFGDAMLAELIRAQPELEADIAPLLDASQGIVDFLITPKIQEMKQIIRPNQMPDKIESIHNAMEFLTPSLHSDHWWAMHVDLGNSLVHSSLGNYAQNVEDAIEAFNVALSVVDSDTEPIKWAWTVGNIGAAYLNRIEGERADNIERSIYLQEQALPILMSENRQESIILLMNLGTVYMHRLYGKRSENIEAAINYYKQVEKVLEESGDNLERIQLGINMGNAFYERLKGEKSKNLEFSIQYYQDALGVCKCDERPNEWATLHNSLGNAYSDHPDLIQGNRSENLGKSIEYYRQAHVVYTLSDYPKDWAMVHHNLATSYYLLGGEENFSLAIQHFKQALKIRTINNLPFEHLETNRVMGNVYFKNKEWAEALAAYHAATETGQLLLESAYTEEGQKVEISQTAQLYARATYCLYKLNHPSMALHHLEEGKTRLLKQSLSLETTNLIQFPVKQQKQVSDLRRTVLDLEWEMRSSADTPARRPNQELSELLRQARTELNEQLAAIRAEKPELMPISLDVQSLLDLIPANGALVIPCITSQGSFAFVLPKTVSEVTADFIIPLPDFTTETLEALLTGSVNDPQLTGWLRSYNHYLQLSSMDAREDWFATIKDYTNMMWDALMKPVHQKLQRFRLSEGAPILLLPQGGLGLLPLHAAWRLVEGQTRYFCDDYTVIYAPSAYALHISRQRAVQPERHVRSLFAAINPTNDPKLIYTLVEGESIAQFFPPANQIVLQKADANTASFPTAAQGHSYIHYSGHGYYHWRDPLQSGLILADKPYTLSDVITGLDLSACRVVTLSACETGITEFQQAPDEYVGLPAGFLQAGAPAVISTLWAVNDLSTMLLMERFYQLHLQQDGLALAPALRQAQLWLRDVTAGELANRFGHEAQQLMTRLTKDEALAYWYRFERMDDGERPFAHPYYWAAFTFTGA